jgi:recombinational DNA repair protein (RecF pathway)
MAIEKYVTRAIILESYDQGEHDKAFKVFSREFGLLICQAKSVRKLESKLRAHILPRSISLITLVQGREVWRLVGAENEVIRSPYIHEATTLLKRFVQGVGAHTTLYDRIISFFARASLYDGQMARLLLYYIFLVELGYADVKAIGVCDSKEYASLSIDDLYTRLLLAKGNVKAHLEEVLQELHL